MNKQRSKLTAIYSSHLLRTYSPIVNPEFRISRLIVIKCRVLAEFVFRTLIDFNHVLRAKQSAKQLKGISRGKKALVIANGPSVKNLDVASVKALQISGELEIFAVNWFALTDIGRQLTPDFYVLSDPATSSLEDDQRAQELWEQLCLLSTTNLILPHSWMKNEGIARFKKVNFFDDRELLGWSKNIKLNRPRGYMSMTAFKALAAALYMEYEEIFVIGFDNSMYLTAFVDENNQLFEKPLHFYPSATEVGNQLSMLYPNGMSDYLYDHARCFYTLRNDFSYPHVMNLDSFSLTDAFKKSKTNYLLTNQHLTD